MAQEFITTITLNKGKIEICVLEIFHHLNQKYLIYQKQFWQKEFLQKWQLILNDITKKTNRKIQKISFIIGDDYLSNIKMQMKNSKLPQQLEANNLSQYFTLLKSNSFKNLIAINQMSSKIEIVKAQEEQKMLINCTTTYAPKSLIEQMVVLAKNSNLTIENIFYASQLRSFAHLSKEALEQGAVLLEINDQNVSLVVNQQNINIEMGKLLDYGWNKLIKEITNDLNCSAFKAHKLLSFYGNLKTIFKPQQTFNNLFHQQKLLISKKLQHFLFNIGNWAKKYLSSLNYAHLPVILVTKKYHNLYLEKCLENFFSYFSVYQPSSFIETSNQNHLMIGLLNYHKLANQIYQENLSIINQNHLINTKFWQSQSIKSNWKLNREVPWAK